MTINGSWTNSGGPFGSIHFVAEDDTSGIARVFANDESGTIIGEVVYAGCPFIETGYIAVTSGRPANIVLLMESCGTHVIESTVIPVNQVTVGTRPPPCTLASGTDCGTCISAIRLLTDSWNAFAQACQDSRQATREANEWLALAAGFTVAAIIALSIAAACSGTVFFGWLAPIMYGVAILFAALAFAALVEAAAATARHVSAVYRVSASRDLWHARQDRVVDACTCSWCPFPGPRFFEPPEVCVGPV